ncbi:MAG: tyrosine-type recombinase/integrase [Magnetococcales bacterium]|nr:tyrosine-type recombinase/integrase [Magnetococcales bacterium]
MAISKSDKGWKVDFRPGGRGGKRFRRVFQTKKEAQRWEIVIRERYLSGKVCDHTKRSSLRLLDLVDMWHEHHGKRLHSEQFRSLKALAGKLGNPLVSSFSVDRFVVYREQRLSEGRAPATLNHEHAYLRAMFNDLERAGLWRGDNPLRGLRQLKIPERELSFLTIEQISKLLEESEKGRNPDLPDVIRVCLSAGTRWNEAEGLRGDQVREGRIILHGTGTKSGKTRSVPISEDLEQRLKLRVDGKEPKLFRSCYAAFRSALKRSEIELPKGQLTHVLRHTFASHFMMNGGNILTLQKILGHQSLAMTMRYAHLSPDHLQEAVRFNPLSFKT